MINKLIKYLRVKDWWSFIVPPVISFYFVGILLSNYSDSDVNKILIDFLFFILLTVSVASFGFFINEWTDEKDDAIAGKTNALYHLSTLNKVFILLVNLFFIIFISLNIKWTNSSFILFIFQLTLFVIYSVPPIRLKRNKYVAILLDALYSGTIFYIIAILIATRGTLINKSFILVLFLWGILKGFRNILSHLLLDAKYDEKLNFKTIATQFNMNEIDSTIKYVLIPLEIILFIILLSQLDFNFLLIAGYIYFIIYLKFRKAYKIPLLLKRTDKIKINFRTELNWFYEIFFPILVIILVIWKTFLGNSIT